MERVLVETISDSDLILGLREGSLDALGMIYDRHQRMVYRTSLAITGDVHAAADLMQDVFLRLHRFADKVDPQRPLEPWLYRVTVNLAYTWVKRHNRWFHPWEEVAEWLVGSKKQSTAQGFEQDETWLQVQQAILSLPLSHRTVVVLYYINDLSLQEIAEILNIPVGTVKSRLHYGRQSLKESLGLISGEALPELKYEFT